MGEQMINRIFNQYNFINPNYELIRHNENMTYKIIDNGKNYVLRIHKSIDGFNVDFLQMGKTRIDLVTGETELLSYLAEKNNLLTQNVIKNIHGNPVTILDDEIPVTVLEWINGNTLDSIEITNDIAHKIGIMIANLHNDLINVSIPNRYRYDENLFEKMIEETNTALEKNHFNEKHTNIMIDVLRYSIKYFRDKKFTIVHSDLGKSNLVYHDDNIIPIDFSLSGYCIPEMDLASIFSHINNEDLNHEILNAYKSVSLFKPENKSIAVCLCLQILLFLVSQHNKIAGQPWLHGKIDEWCENHFIPLLNKEI